ncbi:hypothetical protein REC12_24500 [Desulfosporosinus sp. PR]|uniref:hypothetical protein n=1 Tax=Candidatus Desulfosporosinus nitrosoreducens TaxID=3401928 RepID=UPI0027FD43DC|nr:hypothetical protein [Desulfosporosinus sp. PR]MDQ7096758.1 hypothetical protein [Desulfosporosinus sp. PR]
MGSITVLKNMHCNVQSNKFIRYRPNPVIKPFYTLAGTKLYQSLRERFSLRNYKGWSLLSLFFLEETSSLGLPPLIQQLQNIYPEIIFNIWPGTRNVKSAQASGIPLGLKAGKNLSSAREKPLTGGNFLNTEAWSGREALYYKADDAGTPLDSDRLKSGPVRDKGFFTKGRLVKQIPPGLTITNFLLKNQFTLQSSGTKIFEKLRQNVLRTYVAKSLSNKGAQSQVSAQVIQDPKEYYSPERVEKASERDNRSFQTRAGRVADRHFFQERAGGVADKRSFQVRAGRVTDRNSFQADDAGTSLDSDGLKSGLGKDRGFFTKGRLVKQIPPGLTITNFSLKNRFTLQSSGTKLVVKLRQNVLRTYVAKSLSNKGAQGQVSAQVLQVPKEYYSLKRVEKASERDNRSFQARVGRVAGKHSFQVRAGKTAAKNSFLKTERDISGYALIQNLLSFRSELVILKNPLGTKGLFKNARGNEFLRLTQTKGCNLLNFTGAVFSNIPIQESDQQTVVKHSGVHDSPFQLWRNNPRISSSSFEAMNRVLLEHRGTGETREGSRKISRIERVPPARRITAGDHASEHLSGYLSGRINQIQESTLRIEKGVLGKPERLLMPGSVLLLMRQSFGAKLLEKLRQNVLRTYVAKSLSNKGAQGQASAQVIQDSKEYYSQERVEKISERDNMSFQARVGRVVDKHSFQVRADRAADKHSFQVRAGRIADKYSFQMRADEVAVKRSFQAGVGGVAVKHFSQVRAGRVADRNSFPVRTGGVADKNSFQARAGKVAAKNSFLQAERDIPGYALIRNLLSFRSELVILKNPLETKRLFKNARGNDFLRLTQAKGCNLLNVTKVVFNNIQIQESDQQTVVKHSEVHDSPFQLGQNNLRINSNSFEVMNRVLLEYRGTGETREGSGKISRMERVPSARRITAGDHASEHLSGHLSGRIDQIQESTLRIEKGGLGKPERLLMPGSVFLLMRQSFGTKIFEKLRQNVFRTYMVKSLSNKGAQGQASAQVIQYYSQERVEKASERDNVSFQARVGRIVDKHFSQERDGRVADKHSFQLRSDEVAVKRSFQAGDDRAADRNSFQARAGRIADKHFFQVRASGVADKNSFQVRFGRAADGNSFLKTERDIPGYALIRNLLGFRSELVILKNSLGTKGLFENSRKDDLPRLKQAAGLSFLKFAETLSFRNTQIYQPLRVAKQEKSSGDNALVELVVESPLKYKNGRTLDNRTLPRVFTTEKSLVTTHIKNSALKKEEGLKDKIRQLRPRNEPISMEQRLSIKKLSQYLTGWKGYYALAAARQPEPEPEMNVLPGQASRSKAVSRKKINSSQTKLAKGSAGERLTQKLVQKIVKACQENRLERYLAPKRKFEQDLTTNLFFPQDKEAGQENDLLQSYASFKTELAFIENPYPAEVQAAPGKEYLSLLKRPGSVNFRNTVERVFSHIVTEKLNQTIYKKEYVRILEREKEMLLPLRQSSQNPYQQSKAVKGNLIKQSAPLLAQAREHLVLSHIISRQDLGNGPVEMVMLAPPTTAPDYGAGYARNLPPITHKSKEKTSEKQEQQRELVVKSLNTPLEPRKKVLNQSIYDVDLMNPTELNKLVDKVYRQLETRLVREQRRFGY